ncbi:hypothetical protein [Rheinheimera maricola]|uniref:Uncharacterized protein n=1 Tax=Rheinheimera maricola TaxID=2793282 RepID=A0ABS7X711_9GAMM|nr:hypothetical protein [Rheinheimera maricola]MBZ9611333.1 hypothetical protein [Rheinheimera maricola]
MATIQLLIGGTSLLPSVSNRARKQHEIAKASVQDKSVTIDRVLAARIRNALIEEAQWLETMDVADFRQILEFQGFNTNRFADNSMALYVKSEASLLRGIALKLLRDDLIKAETPIIISGDVSGAIGMVAKILGPTFVANFSSVGVTLWWDCKSDCRIESIHVTDKKMHRVIKP